MRYGAKTNDDDDKKAKGIEQKSYDPTSNGIITVCYVYIEDNVLSFYILLGVLCILSVVRLS